MTIPTLETAAREYLRGKRVTLWGDWDLTRPDSFEQAVEWLTRVTVDVNSVLEDQWEQRQAEKII